MNMANTNTGVKTSLVDILDSNKTVRDNISKNNEGDIYTVGTKANDAANAWWEQHGATLYPDTQLVSPEEILKDKNAPVPVTAADLMGNTALSDEQALAETAYANTQTPEYLAGIQAQAGVDVNKAYESDVSRFQTDIDALDRAIVEKRTALSAQYDQIGRGRQGTATAIQARRGLLGSDMGEQYQSELTTQTQGEKNSAIALADAEYNSQRSSIRDKQLGLTQIIRKEQSDEAALRLSASKSGSQAKLDEIKNRKVRATEAIVNIVQNALSGDIDLSKPESKQALEELAKTYGTTPKAIIAQYNQAVSEQLAAALKAEQEAAKAYKDTLMTLKEGDIVTDVNGNVVAQGAGKRYTLTYGDTLTDADGTMVASGGEDPMNPYKQAEISSQIDMMPYKQAEIIAQIEKIENEIEQTNDPLIRATKEAELDNLLAKTEEIRKGGTTAGAPTQAQAQAGAYATRMEEANKILEDNQAIWESWGDAKQWGESIAPNQSKSSEQQQIEQAQRNFINSLLRKESGAAIADSEFKNYQKQYFPQSGDGKEVIAQKKANRATAINGMKTMASAANNVTTGNPELDSIFG